MNTKVIKQSDPQSSEIAKMVLMAGGVVAIPTDTVYGIACHVYMRESIQRLYAIKERDRMKAIPVLIGSMEHIPIVAADFPLAAQTLAEHFWPGALTIVLNKNPELPTELTNYSTVGLRMPNHFWLISLMQSCGPLATTSANISGQNSLRDAQDVLDALKGRIDLLIDGGICKGGFPSSVIDCTVSPVKVLREGSVTEQAILRELTKR